MVGTNEQEEQEAVESMNDSNSSVVGVASLGQVGGRETYAADVTRVLRQAILTGRFQDGDRLNLNRLSDQLGVSVMPIREALVTLANEGLVVNQRNRGFRARPLKQQDVDDVFALHAHISGILAGRAAAVSRPEDISELRRLHAEFCTVVGEGGITGSELDSLNDSFHRKLNSMGEGTRLRWFLRLTSRLIPTDRYSSVTGWCNATLDYHPRIIDAVEAHDSASASALVEEHFTEGLTLTKLVSR